MGKTTTCKYCKKKGLTWKEDKSSFKLYEGDKRHDCPVLERNKQQHLRQMHSFLRNSRF